MANYYGVGRTNYVTLKDEASYVKFNQLVVLLGGETSTQKHGGITKITAFGNDEDGGFSSYVDVEGLVKSGYVSPHADSELNAHDERYLTDQDGMSESDDEIEFTDSFLNELYPLLADDQVLVFQSVGNEKTRYVCGYAGAISHLGETVSVNIDDIYQKAKEAFKLSKEPSTASY